MTLKSRLIVRLLIIPPVLSALLLLPNGSINFWQGLAFMALLFAFMLVTYTFFYTRDPALLESRLNYNESAREQFIFKAIWVPLWIAALVLAALDHRFRWSANYLRPVPLWLTLVSFGVIVCSYSLIFQVLKFNSFAASIIRVVSRQQVISNGPYRLVRHPMYTGIVLLILATPLALASYVSIPVFLPLIPLLVYRLTHEERMLREKLTGYAEYCQHTRFRLIPHFF